MADMMLGEFKINGLLLSDRLVHVEMVDYVKHMQVYDDDIFVCGYMRSGTTWLQEMVWLIRNKADIVATKEKSIYSGSRVFYLPGGSIADNEDRILAMPRPRTFKCHLPYDMLPSEVSSKQIKVIYVIRNPKDVAVSHYHHRKMVTAIGGYKGPWSEYLAKFEQGEVYMGSWFNMTLRWYQLQHLDNILFLKYEDMIKDHRGTVIKLAKFMGNQLTSEEIQLIVDHTKFKEMKDRGSGLDKRHGKSIINEELSPFFRKGQVGDWMNYFTVNQNKQFDKLFEEKMSGMNTLSFDWGNSD